MTTDVPAEVRLTDLLGCSDARPRVLDPASGSRMMWFDRGHPDVVFGDKRRETVKVTDRSHGRADGTRTLTVDPDLLMDFRALPFEDGTFRLVAFDRWCADNGHGTIDDMLAPLDRSLRELMWSAWQGRGALRIPCRGVTRDGCHYLAPCGSICNKCGHEH